METIGPQQLVFQQIKGLLPPHLTMVDAVAELLNISNDSAYRRIRGEKPLTLDEVQILASHYKISIDQLLHLKSDAFVFTGRTTNNADYKYEHWLQSVIGLFQNFINFKPNHLYYLAKEVPFYYYFMFPEIAAFKSFFFMKSILYYEDWKTVKFSVKADYSKYHELMQKCSHLYAQIPSTEIWSIENVTSTLNQIEFYRATGSMESDEDAIIVLDKLIQLLEHLELQAEHGLKLLYNQNPASGTVPYKMFVNELIMGDNMQLIQLGDNYITGVNHSVINFMMTTDPSFNAYSKKTMDNIAHKSTLISGVNEKERIMFFNRMRGKVNAAKRLITG